MENNEENPLILTGDALAQITRAETDVQVETAKKYPRELGRCIENAIIMATIDRETAEAMSYTLPGRGDTGKAITGFSIRLAEVMKTAWKNISVGTRIVGNDGRFVTAQSVAIDYENNVRESCEVKMSIYGKHGTYSQNMQQVTMSAAMAKAKRNAILAVIPNAITKKVAEAANKVVAGTIDELPENRKKAFAFFAKNYMVSEDRILKRLERSTIEEVDQDDIVILRGIMTALKDEMTTVAEAFPIEPVADQETKQKSATDSLKNTAKDVSKQAEQAKLKKLKFGMYNLRATEDCLVKDNDGNPTPFMIGDVVTPSQVVGVFIGEDLYFNESELVEKKFEREAL